MVYKTECSRRLYSSSDPQSGGASSFSYSSLGRGRPLALPPIALQKLSGSAAPPRSNYRLNELYSELEDEVAANSQGLGALVPYRRSVTPLRSSTPVRGFSPVRSLTPGPIRSITYSRHEPSDFSQLAFVQELQLQPLVRSRADDVLLHLALGLHPPLYSLHHIPLRSALDVKEACDVRRQFVHERNMHDPLSRVQSEIYRMAFNRQPRRVPTGYVGSGTLACLSYAGGRPIPKRRRFYREEETQVVEDLKFNNYYKPSAVGSYYSTVGRKPTYQPIYRSKKSLLGLPETPNSYKKVESKWELKTASKRSPSPPAVGTPPRRLVSFPPPEPRKAAPVAVRSDNVSITLPHPRKSSDLPDKHELFPPPSPSQLPVPDASVVFKIPRKSISQEPPESALKLEQSEEEIFQIVKLKRPSLQPAPAPEPEPNPEPVKEPETEPEPVIVAASKLEPEPVSIDEPEPEPQLVPAAELESEPQLESELAPATQQPETESQSEPEPAEAPVAESEPEPAEAPVAESEPEPAGAPAAESEPEPAEAPAAESEPEPTEAPAAESEPEPQLSEPSTDPEPQAESESEQITAEEAAAPAKEPPSEAEAEPAQDSKAGIVAEDSSVPAAEPEPVSETPVPEENVESAAESVSEAACAVSAATEEVSAPAGEEHSQGEVTLSVDEPPVEPEQSVGENDSESQTENAAPVEVEGYSDPEELPLDQEEEEVAESGGE